MPTDEVSNNPDYPTMSEAVSMTVTQVTVYPLDALGWPMMTESRHVPIAAVMVGDPTHRVRADNEEHTEMVLGTAHIGVGEAQPVAMRPATAVDVLTADIPRNRVRVEAPPVTQAPLVPNPQTFALVELNGDGELVRVMPVHTITARYGIGEGSAFIEASARVADALWHGGDAFSALTDAVRRARETVTNFAATPRRFSEVRGTGGVWREAQADTLNREAMNITLNMTTVDPELERILTDEAAQSQAPAPSRTVFAFNVIRRTNADLILDAHRLRYLRNDDVILDATYGRGVMWRRWTPLRGTLMTNDLLREAHTQTHHDFRWLPYTDRAFDAVVFDPPYKLNGTPSTDDVDARYGVDTYTRWQDRYALIEDGLVECARVAKRTLLVKCMDQVVSGRVRWQTHDFVNHVHAYTGMRLVDELHLPGSREQPAGRRQVHARRNYSTLLVFNRERRRSTTEHYRPTFEREALDDGGYLITHRLTGVVEARDVT